MLLLPSWWEGGRKGRKKECLALADTKRAVKHSTYIALPSTDGHKNSGKRLFKCDFSHVPAEASERKNSRRSQSPYGRVCAARLREKIDCLPWSNQCTKLMLSTRG